MTRLDRADVARLIEGYTVPEADPYAPMLAVLMSPQAALWLMSAGGMSSIDATIIPPLSPSEEPTEDATAIPAGAA